MAAAVIEWTEDRVESLKKLWSDGASAGRIADELGGAGAGFSRNAVIGKLTRLGLKGGDRPLVDRKPVGGARARPVPANVSSGIEIPGWVLPEHHAIYRSIAAEQGEEKAASWARRAKNGEPVPPPPQPRQQPQQAKREARSKPRTVNLPAPPPARAEVKEPAAPAQEVGHEVGPDQGVHIADLEFHHCRWRLLGEREDTRYCGARRPDPKRPYCAKHQAQASSTARETREERAIRVEMARSATR